MVINLTVCDICVYACILSEGSTGRCGYRQAIGEKNVDLAKNSIPWYATNRIEKVPLYHINPNQVVFVLATTGCNIKCFWCVNSNISLISQPDALKVSRQFSPGDLIALALEKEARAIAFLFSEPVIHPELVAETFRAGRKAGLNAYLKTNGTASIQTLKKIADAGMDAINIDIKGSRTVYNEVFHVSRDSVFDQARWCLDNGIHLELTTSIIPGINGPREITEIAEEIRTKIGKDVPLHVHKYLEVKAVKGEDLSDADTKTLYADIKKSLNYVYFHDLDDRTLESTFCPICKKELITRVCTVVIKRARKLNRCCNNVIQSILHPIKGQVDITGGKSDDFSAIKRYVGC